MSGRLGRVVLKFSSRNKDKGNASYLLVPNQKPLGFLELKVSKGDGTEIAANVTRRIVACE